MKQLKIKISSIIGQIRKLNRGINNVRVLCGEYKDVMWRPTHFFSGSPLQIFAVTTFPPTTYYMIELWHQLCKAL